MSAMNALAGSTNVTTLIPADSTSEIQSTSCSKLCNKSCADSLALLS